MQFARLDGADASAVCADDRGFLQFAMGHDFTDAVTDTAGGQSGHDAFFDIVGNDIGGLTDRGSRQLDVLEAHRCDRAHDHVDHVVTVTEVMMEGNGHTVPEAALFDGFLDRGDHLVAVQDHVRADLGADFGVFVIRTVFIALEGFPARIDQFLRDLSVHSIFHITDPPCTRRKPWPAQ